MSNDRITDLLAKVRPMDKKSWNPVFELILEDVKKVVRARKSGAVHGLRTTEIADDALLRLFKWPRSEPHLNRRALFADIAHLVGHSIRDIGRRRNAKKRGGDHQIKQLESGHDGEAPSLLNEELAERVFREAVQALHVEHRRAALVLELRAGQAKLEDIAKTAGISRNTVKSDLDFARAFMLRRLEEIIP